MSILDSWLKNSIYGGGGGGSSGGGAGGPTYIPPKISLYPTPAYASGGQVAGASTQAGSQTSTGPLASMVDWSKTPYQPSPAPKTTYTSSGGGRTTSGTNNLINAGLQEIPAAPDTSQIDFSPAFQALDQLEGALKEGAAGGEQSLMASQNTAIGRETLNQKQAQTEAEKSQAQAGQSLEAGQAETRRQAAELQQGIQSRFGGTTATGAGISEILGGQAMKNLASLRTTYQGTINSINGLLQKARDESAQRISEIQTSTQANLTELKNSLAMALAQVAGKRGEFSIQAADKKMGLLQEYQNQVQQIKAANQNWIQQVLLKQQAAESGARNAATTAAEKTMKLYHDSFLVLDAFKQNLVAQAFQDFKGRIPQDVAANINSQVNALKGQYTQAGYLPEDAGTLPATIATPSTISTPGTQDSGVLPDNVENV